MDKILVFGGLVPNLYIVEWLKKSGMYVIVADNISDSKAKQVADESLQISLDDIDGLVDYCKNNQVKGIIHGSCGFGERYYPQVCQKLNLPCWGSTEIANVFGNKYEFKKMCQKYGLDIIDTFEIGLDECDSIKEYPVVVKPADSSGSKGVSLCYSPAELFQNLNKALQNSYSDKAIVEKYLTCNQVNLSICVNNGDVYTSVHDRLAYRDESGFSSITHLMVYPSRYTDLYYEKTDRLMKSMVESFKVSNVFLFAQAFVDDGKFRFFDPGMRFTGCQEYLFEEKAFGTNIIAMTVDYAINGVNNKAYSIKHFDKYMNGKFYAVFCFIAGRGEIASIEGIDNIKSDADVFNVTQFLYPGDTIERVGTTQQTVMRVHLCCDSKIELQNAVYRLQGMLSVKDVEGNEMVWPGYDKDNYWEAGGLKSWLTQQLF